jgi:hypothetical protein
MLKPIIRTAVTVCATLFPVAHVQAEPSDRALAKWVQKVNLEMDHWADTVRSANAGTAQISFRRGADGRATDVIVRRGNASTAAAAVEILHLIGKLPPMPKGYGSDQRVVLNYMIGEHNDLAYRQQRSRMLASARLANLRLAAQMDGAQLAALEAR